MKRISAIILTVMLFLSAFVSGKGPEKTEQPLYPDSLRTVWLYTEGIKRNTIFQDSVRAEQMFREAISLDSTYAPAYYELFANNMYSSPDEAVDLARKAYRTDSANLWYHRSYGQALIMAGRYGEAIGVFRDLCDLDKDSPDNYRLLAALYEQEKNPYMALAILDSAEIRFGRIPYLGIMKRRLLISTYQFDKAIDEAREAIRQAPYEIENHIDLGDLYGYSGKDSLAMLSYERALGIDSTNLPTLLAISDHYSRRHNYLALLDVTKKIFLSKDLPVSAKVDRFKRFTADVRFYREYYLQLSHLASTLMVLYPRDKEVVDLYAGHLIASGELDRALELYKEHLDDTPPQKDYYISVIDIESYKQRPDSVRRYVERALQLFPGETRFHLARGNALIYAKRFDDGIAAYRSSLRYAPDDSTRSAIWGIVGDTYHLKAESEAEARKEKTLSRKLIKRCYEAYDRSLGLNPENALVLNNYAYFLSQDGERLEEALDMAGRVLALTENNPTYLDTYAWILHRLGRSAEAKKTMQQALALDGHSSSELLLHYGDILNALGERFLAETYWRKALEKGADAEEVTRRFEDKKPTE